MQENLIAFSPTKIEIQLRQSDMQVADLPDSQEVYHTTNSNGTSVVHLYDDCRFLDLRKTNLHTTEAVCMYRDQIICSFCEQEWKSK